jgi:hypothetical protein
MGRQSSLLLTNDDLRDIEAMLRARGDVALLSDTANEGRNALLPLKALPITRPGQESLQCFLARAEEPRHVIVETVSDVKVSVDIQASEVIELWRSYCPGEVIRTGRVYYAARYWDGESIQDKGREFVSWAEKTVAAIRRSLKYDKTLQAYAGACAARLIASEGLTVIY